MFVSNRGALAGARIKEDVMPNISRCTPLHSTTTSTRSPLWSAVNTGPRKPPSRKPQQHALQHALAAGDALLAAREKVTRSREQWVRRECRIKLRSAQVYMQLARGRAVLEAQSSAPLSIAAALRILNGARKKPPGKKRALSPASWLAASPEERTQFSERDRPPRRPRRHAGTLDEGHRGAGARTARRKPAAAMPDLAAFEDRTHRALDTSRSLIPPRPVKPAAQGQACAALAALRATHNAALRAIGRDLHDVEIVLAAAGSERSSKRKRAA